MQTLSELVRKYNLQLGDIVFGHHFGYPKPYILELLHNEWYAVGGGISRTPVDNLYGKKIWTLGKHHKYKIEDFL